MSHVLGPYLRGSVADQRSRQVRPSIFCGRPVCLGPSVRLDRPRVDDGMTLWGSETETCGGSPTTKSRVGGADLLVHHTSHGKHPTPPGPSPLRLFSSDGQCLYPHTRGAPSGPGLIRSTWTRSDLRARQGDEVRVMVPESRTSTGGPTPVSEDGPERRIGSSWGVGQEGCPTGLTTSLTFRVVLFGVGPFLRCSM